MASVRSNHRGFLRSGGISRGQQKGLGVCEVRGIRQVVGIRQVRIRKKKSPWGCRKRGIQ